MRPTDPLPSAGKHAMDLDSNLLMASLLFGTIGMGMLLFGKKSGRTMPLIAGLGLLTLPYSSRVWR